MLELVVGEGHRGRERRGGGLGVFFFFFFGRRGRGKIRWASGLGMGNSKCPPYLLSEHLIYSKQIYNIRENGAHKDKCGASLGMRQIRKKREKESALAIILE